MDPKSGTPDDDRLTADELDATAEGELAEAALAELEDEVEGALSELLEHEAAHGAEEAALLEELTAAEAEARIDPQTDGELQVEAEPLSDAAPDEPAPPDLECLGFIVRRAARGLSKHFDDALSKHELNLSQFNLLDTMSKAGLRSLTEIGARTTTDRTTLNRTLGHLEKLGLVASHKGCDKRTRRFKLTPLGRERLTAARPTWRAVQAELHALLGKSRFARLHKDLGVLLERLDG